MGQIRITGIAGAGRGTGTTHLALLAANFLTSCLQRRTAFLEWNSHGDLVRIGSGLLGLDDSAKTKGFALLGTDFYLHGDSRVLTECMDGRYEDIVVDFGEIRGEIREDWLRCGRSVMAVSLSEWKIGAFLDFLETEERPAGRGVYAAAFGSEDTRKEIERRFRIRVERIPLSADAFVVDRQMMSWLRDKLRMEQE